MRIMRLKKRLNSTASSTKLRVVTFQAKYLRQGDAEARQTFNGLRGRTCRQRCTPLQCDREKKKARLEINGAKITTRFVHARLFLLRRAGGNDAIGGDGRQAPAQGHRRVQHSHRLTRMARPSSGGGSSSTPANVTTVSQSVRGLAQHARPDERSGLTFVQSTDLQHVPRHFIHVRDELRHDEQRLEYHVPAQSVNAAAGASNEGVPGKTDTIDHQRHQPVALRHPP